MCGSGVENFAKKGLKLFTGVSALQEGVRGLRKVGAIPESRAEQQGQAVAEASASRAAADAEASGIANARIRAQRKAMRENSLLTGAGGRTTLGV